MELKGKKNNFLGDSITEGCCATLPEWGYVDVMKEKYHLAEARNYGIGGSRIARQKVPSEVPKFDLYFASRVEEMDPDADIIVIFGGTNDHGHGDAPLGTDEDRTVDTFFGAFHILLQETLKKYPRATTVVVTPLHRAEEVRDKDDLTLRDYVNSIKTVAAQYPVKLLDLYECSAIRGDIPEIAGKLTTDGLHPNDEGHAILAAEIGEFLKAL